MASELTTTNVLDGELITPTMRNTIKTRVAIKTTVMVAEAQVKVARSVAAVELLGREMREHASEHELRLKQLNHAHAKFDMVAEHELHMLQAELDAIKARK
jgi:hypothetical protein